MKHTMHMILLAALALAGCRVVEVENRGDGQGWRVYHNQHWMTTRADTITATVQPGGAIRFTMNGLNSEPSDELRLLIDTSLKGAAELAAKVGAAIATSGGSVAGDAGAALLQNAIAKYIANGGSAEKAQVTCEGGNCTITDGTVTETCADCVDSR